MSLLQNEEFVLYQLRTAYLSHIKDGVGERVINVNAAVLNNPAFRAAGWVPNTDIKRTYSPPIPTAITAEYFQAPRSAGLPGASFGDDEDERGMVTGGGSTDTVGPSLMAKVKRRKEQLEEDDSSDLSDESDEEETAQRAAQQIKFNKTPLRTRADSSPSRSSNPPDGPSLLVTSSSRPPESGRFRRGSLGQVEAVKARARRDTTTSSEMSSENEIDPLVFQRKQINPRQAAKSSAILSQRIQEDEQEAESNTQAVANPGVESDDSSLNSEFEESADSGSFLGEVADASSSPLETRLKHIPPAITPHSISPRKSKQALSLLQDLPPPRPISVIQPVSALTAALKAKNKKPESPFEQFASLSGKGDPNPLYIKIYAPFSNKPNKPYEVLLRRTVNDGLQPTVADAIGLALWRYGEEGLKPLLRGEKMNVNRWTLRMVEDEEVDFDFPALARTRPVTDFTLNNNRGARGRSREKPWDEFALVESSQEEFRENEKLTPSYNTTDSAPSDVQEEPEPEPLVPLQTQAPTQTPTPTLGTFRNPITGPSFAPTAIRKDSTALLDQPAIPVSHATPRTGAPKTLAIHFTDDNLLIRTISTDVTTDTYIAEVFDQVCKKLKVDKALYVLKVSGTNTVAPSDRTIEALGDRADLDLARRRFIGDGAFGLSGSPGSSSPNAPLLITPGTPKKGKKGGATAGAGVLHPLAQRNDAFLTANTTNYKRYNVTRKQPMSFSSSSSRILALDGEYMHIMPSEGAGGTKTLFEAPTKTTTVHLSSVVGSKVSRRHPRMFRVVVYKERETKRYDFEAQSQAEAQEIVREIKKGVEKFQGIA